jgi:hypothetical protein
MATIKKDFENLLKKGINTPLFKKLPISEMHNLQDGRIWEIKLNGQDETIFAKLMVVQYVGDLSIGYLDVITNMFEVDENGEKPVIEKRTIHDSDIEGAFLTQMSL